MIRHFFTLLLFSWVPLLGYAQGIPDFSANYLVRINGLSAGELKRELTTAENGLRTFTSQTQAKGIFSFFKPDLIEETSIWTLQENAVHSQTYIYQRTGGKKDKYLSVRFDWNQQQVDIDNTKQTFLLKIQPNTLDKLNYQIALMLDLEQQKKEFSYQIVDKHKLRMHNIAIIGTEIIDTPLGKIETVKLKRQREGKNQRQTSLWCAPKLNYLPVKIEHIEKDGTRFTAELRQLKGLVITDVFKKAPKQANLLLP